MSYTYTDQIKFAPTNNFDAFGRLRISDPFTLFDSSNRYRDNGYWMQSVSGGGSSSFNSNQGLIDMTVTAANGDQVVRETAKVFSYQPGKSLLILNTFVFASAQSGLRQRVGYFGTQNGIYLELNDSTLSIVKRSYVSGVISDTPITQANWNVDSMDGNGPSGITLDISKAQIFWIDVEWLGVGSVRCGFVVDGQFYTCHIFNHANIITSTYMTTACLPLRYEITNTTATSGATLKQICSSVISEGGYELKGLPRTVQTPISTPYTVAAANTYYPLISIRLKSTNLDAIVLPSGVSIISQDSANYEFRIMTGGTTVGGTWVQPSDSNVEYNISGSSLTGGTSSRSMFFSQTNQSGGTISLQRNDTFSFQLTRNSFTSTPHEFTLLLAADAVGGGGNQVWGALDWEEITR